MQYKGQLYGRVGGKHFPLEMTADQVDNLVDACETFVKNVEKWLETGVPATPEESKAIYEKAKNALSGITDEDVAVPVTVEVYPFEDFWNDYDKKVGSKPKLLKKWQKLSKASKLKIRDYIPLYKAAQPDKRYRKNPETFLNNESWNDEIIGTKKSIPDNYKRELLEELLA